MKHVFLCTDPRLRLALIALVAGLISCTLNVAYGDSAHWQDQVTITGSPATQVGSGELYSFTPSATDTSNRVLTFAVTNMPPWASFNATTGQVLGKPSAGSVGIYPNIVIEVSDGWQSAALAPFSIEVTPAPATGGSATVNVIPPTENTNGTALTDLAGVTIFYGSSPSNLSQEVQIPGTTPTTHTIDNLASGTWYFGAVAYTTRGVESAMSGLASAKIP